MKKLKVTYFKPGSGKYYTQEEQQVTEGLDFWELVDLLRKPGVLRITDMDALVEDGDDHKEPYFVPHLFKIKGV